MNLCSGEAGGAGEDPKAAVVHPGENFGATTDDDGQINRVERVSIFAAHSVDNSNGGHHRHGQSNHATLREVLVNAGPHNWFDV